MITTTTTTAASARPFLDSIALRDEGAHGTLRRFSAQPQYVPWAKAYGGDSVAQALAAATRTVDPERAVHSMHSYFLRPVAIDQRVSYEVSVTRDGRGYSHRDVSGIQAGAEVFHATMSFAAPAEGDAFALPQPLDVRPPEELPSAEEYLGGETGAAAEYWARGRSFDMRHDPEPLYGAEGSERGASQAVWLRAFSEIPRDPATQRLALAYVCDYTILEPLLRVQGASWRSAGLATASLDNAIWFHRPADLNEWTLYVQDAVSVQNDRGLSWGRFYSRDGALLASVAQEGVLRLPQRSTSS